MNKIKRDNSNFLLENESFLEIKNYQNIEIIISKNEKKKLEIIGTSDYQIKIVLEEDSKLIINALNKDNSVKVDISLKHNANIIYNHSVVTTKDSDNYFNINHLEDGSTSVINNNGINLSKGKLFFTIDGKIPKYLENINCSQNSKIINYENSNSKIIPNLLIDSNDIIANHSAYIGYINKEEAFYMETRGITKENIRYLIYKATMLGKMKLLQEERFNQIINEWW